MPVGNAEGDLITSWLNPTSIVIGVIAVGASAYLAAVYLAGDAARAGVSRPRGASAAALAAPRRRGSRPSPGSLVLRADARELFDDLTSGAGWPPC